MGELFAHFEKKWENFWKNTKISHDFSQCSTSTASEPHYY